MHEEHMLIKVKIVYHLLLHMMLLICSFIYYRLKLWFCDPDLYPQHEFIQAVPRSTVHGFTALQLACVAALWTLKHSPWGSFCVNTQ